jgi:hypothetical protein
MRPVCLLLASLSLGICPSVGAQESAPKEKTTSAAMAVTKRGHDEKAIADLVAAFAKAFNDNDAAAAAATFADDALVVDERGERTEAPPSAPSLTRRSPAAPAAPSRSR